MTNQVKLLKASYELALGRFAKAWTASTDKQAVRKLALANDMLEKVQAAQNAIAAR